MTLALVSCAGSKTRVRAPSAEFSSTSVPGAIPVAAPARTATPDTGAVGAATLPVGAKASGSVLRQPPKSSGGLIPSSWRQPKGSTTDRSVWDNFLFETAHTITEFRWVGGYDPAKAGSGGPVLSFSVDIHGSIPAGSEPNLALAPLVHYVVDGNAGETKLDPIGGAPLYEYRFTLPQPFVAEAMTPYWVQIVAFQAGDPDWGFAIGSLGDGRHFRFSGAPGEGYYHQLAPEDVSLELVAVTEGVPTPVPNVARSLEEIEEQLANLPPAEEIPVGADGIQEVMLVVSRSGYTPVHLSVRAGVPVRLTFRQLGYVPGGNELNVRWGPNEGTYVMLASVSDKRVLEFTPKTPGEYRYSCPHEWYWGVMTVRE
jgi:hypothetical protein